MKRKLFWCLSSIFCFVAAYFLIGVLSNFFLQVEVLSRLKGFLLLLFYSSMDYIHYTNLSMNLA